ncbi:LuxR C-terminal-related transcriptional regulator [Glycocaulis abyssi]|uniref:LuxR C-terminal-related transcriptional regulator n=1 Tax=Glycocaulis abyssi TaxID=1433403 RepID=A0ABV9NH22_9PROT
MADRKFRRIVTAADEHGKSRVLRDSHILPSDFRAVHWFTRRNADALRDPPHQEIAGLPLAPPRGATTFQFIIVPPDRPHVTREQLDAYYATVFDGTDTVRVDTHRHPGMHRTDTIDYITVLQGELTLILSDDEVVLKPFDTVIQRHTAHAWANRGDMTAVFVAMTVDLALAGTGQAGEADRLEFAALYGLTPSELAVALALTGGASLQDIAAERGVTINTVRTHAARLREKLGVHSQADIVRTTLVFLGAVTKDSEMPHPNG